MKNATRVRLLLVAISLTALFLSTAPAGACEGYHEAECITTNHYATLELCNQALAKDKEDFHAWVDRGTLYARMGMDEQAANDLDQATSLLDAKAQARAKARAANPEKSHAIRKSANKHAKFADHINQLDKTKVATSPKDHTHR